VSAGAQRREAAGTHSFACGNTYDLRAEPYGRLSTHIRHVTKLHDDPPPLPRITPDPTDDYLVAFAQATRSDYLVSGDTRLTELPDPQLLVLTPHAFLEQLN
jgi:predicted nucleic acid-binding protein